MPDSNDTSSRETKYSDMDLRFIPHPITKNPIILRNEAAVAQAIKRIVLTNYGDVPFEYFKGGDIRSLLFESADGLTAFILKQKIQRAIDTHEDRVRVRSVDVIYENEGDDCFITVDFEVIAINRFGSVEFNLKRIR